MATRAQMVQLDENGRAHLATTRIQPAGIEVYQSAAAKAKKKNTAGKAVSAGYAKKAVGGAAAPESVLKDIPEAVPVQIGDSATAISPGTGSGSGTVEGNSSVGSGGTGSSDLDQYTLLAESYKKQQEVLDAGRRNALQRAGISFDTLNKYLPMMNRANGLSGLGVSETASIDAYNKYLSSMGSIEQQHSADSASLLDNYSAERRALVREEQEKAEEEALREEQKAEEEALREAEKTATDQTLMFEHMYNMIDTLSHTQASDIDRYLETARGRVSDTQFALLKDLAQTRKAEWEQLYGSPQSPKTLEAQQLAASVLENGVSFYENKKGLFYKQDLSNGDDFTVQDSTGKKYYIESRGRVDNEELAALASGVANNQLFAYGYKIYYKINGEIYEVGGRKGKNNSEDYTELYNRFYGVDNHN